MQEEVKKLFILPSGEYDADFIRGLAMAVHLQLINPKELDSLFHQNLSHFEIAQICLQRVKRNMAKRNKV